MHYPSSLKFNFFGNKFPHGHLKIIVLRRFIVWYFVCLYLIALSNDFFSIHISLKTTLVMKILAALFVTASISFISVIANAQACTLKCPENIVVKADSTKEGATVNFPAATTSGDCGTITYSQPSGSFFRIGSHSIVVTSPSGQKCSFTITVTDNEPPVLSPVTLSSKKLWPPSNKMKKVGVYYTTTDNAEEVNTTLSVSSNDDSGERDWEVVNNHMLRLKAARLSNGEARVYTIKVSSSDMAGNTTTRTTSIVVSKTMITQDVVVN